MEKQSNRNRLAQFSIKGVLLATLLVAVFLAGRYSQEDRIQQLESELQEIASRKKTPTELMNELSMRLDEQKAKLDQELVELGLSPRSPPIVEQEKYAIGAEMKIEMGMKATELEMKTRLSDRPSELSN